MTEFDLIEMDVDFFCSQQKVLKTPDQFIATKATDWTRVTQVHLIIFQAQARATCSLLHVIELHGSCQHTSTVVVLLELVDHRVDKVGSTAVIGYLNDDDELLVLKVANTLGAESEILLDRLTDLLQHGIEMSTMLDRLFSYAFVGGIQSTAGCTLYPCTSP